MSTMDWAEVIIPVSVSPGCGGTPVDLDVMHILAMLKGRIRSGYESKTEETMLVKFESEVGSVSMFGDVAVALLKMMGHSGTVPSALLAKDIATALAKLNSAVGMTPADSRSGSEDGDGAQSNVALRKRAFPLIELMERAATRAVDITWAAA